MFSRHLIAVLLLVYVAYGLVDLYLLGELASRVLLVRFTLGLPALLGLYVHLHLRPQGWASRYCLPLSLLVLIVSTLAMLYFLTGLVLHLYMSSLLAIVMGGLTISRMRFRPAVLVSMLYVLLFSYVLVDIQVAHAWYYFLLSSAVVGFSLAGVWYGELAMRHNYVQRLLIQRKNRELLDSNRNLQEQAIRDPMTGIANRRQFDHVLDEECRRARRRGYPVAMLMVDIDFFKAYNDSLGHPAGDQCIVRVAQALAALMHRPGDLVARYGGEEFAVILPALTPSEAQEVAEDMLQAIRLLQVAHPASSVAPYVTVSIGVASLQPSEALTCKDLIELADKALYVAKHSGRNRVCVAAD